MSTTVSYAKMGDPWCLTSDGRFVPAAEIEIIDLATGKPPLDAHGKLLLFTEVDTVAGFGKTIDGEIVFRRFEMRHGK